MSCRHPRYPSKLEVDYDLTKTGSRPPIIDSPTDEETTVEKLIAAIPKNQREEILVALSEFEKDGKTYDMVSARVHYDAGDGEMKPGRNGLSVPVRLLPELVAALRQAGAEARAAGLLPDEVDEAPAPETTILGAG